MSEVALLIEQMIAAPLKAMIDAQRASAQATTDFLFSLMKKENNNLVPETLEIVYEQMIQNADTGGIETKKQSLSVPLLSLVPTPYISIDESEIEFDAKIIAQRDNKLYASFASKSKSSTEISSEMHVKIKVKRSDIPDGLAKLLTVVSNPIIKG